MAMLTDKIAVGVTLIRNLGMKNPYTHILIENQIKHPLTVNIE